MNILFDRRLTTARKIRAARNAVEGSDFLMQRACSDLADRLSVIERHFENAYCLFCSSQLPADVLRASGKVDKITRIEADRALLGRTDGMVQKDEIFPVGSGQADLVVSIYALHEINDVPGLLAQIRRALKPDGLFLAALAGADTLTELRNSLLAAEVGLTDNATARIYPFMDIRDAGALLQRAGFNLPVTDVDTTTVRYPSVEALFRDLRAMGATNAMQAESRRPLSRAVLEATADFYRERYTDDDGRLRATFNTIWLSGWAPHSSQQKPLKPGTASASLAEALEYIEKKER